MGSSKREKLNAAKQIYEDVMNRISSDKEEWKAFLEFSSKFYKYSFTENLLMFGQDRDITMCATLPEWNSIGRWVKPKSKSIKILRDTEENVELDYVFDVKDTYARRDIPNAYTDKKLEMFKWTATEEQAIEILNNYFHYENTENLESAVTSYIATELDNSGLLLNLSEEEEMLVLKPEFLGMVIKNTTYQVATRCGIEIEDTDRIFDEYKEMANPTVINILGNCINHCSSELLRIIEYKIKQIKKEELKYGSIKQVWNNSEKEHERVVSNEVQSIDNRGNTNGEIDREGTRNIEAEGDNRETSKREESSTENERVYSDGTIQPDDRELGGRDVTTNASRENLDDSKEVENSTSFSFGKSEVSEELINKVLSNGGNVQDSVKRLKEILKDNTLTTKEQIVATRKEYGDAGSYGGEYDWESRAKGLTITDKTTNVQITLSWADVVKKMKKIFHIENEQLGFETLFNLSYQQDDIVEQQDNSKYDFINDLIGKNIKLEDREYQVTKLNLEAKEIELYDKSIKGWFPILRVMDLDNFVLEYTKSNSIEQNEEEIIQEKINYQMPLKEETRNLRQRANDNINAIKLLKEIESQGRLATKNEQEILAKYSGWGGLSRVFDKRAGEWQVEEIELRENLTEEELEEARSSSLNAFYTNPDIVDSIYLGLARLGFRGGNILEPSARNRKFYRKITKQSKYEKQIYSNRNRKYNW